jgi:hypothetical protein
MFIILIYVYTLPEIYTGNFGLNQNSPAPSGIFDITLEMLGQIVGI